MCGLADVGVQRTGHYGPLKCCRRHRPLVVNVLPAVRAGRAPELGTTRRRSLDTRPSQHVA